MINGPFIWKEVLSSMDLLFTEYSVSENDAFPVADNSDFDSKGQTWWVK